MFRNVWRRGRMAVVIGAFAAGVVATGVASAGTATAQSQAQSQAQARMPWSKVGPGWVLVQYFSGYPLKPVATLYLISPSGTKYALRTWQNSRSGWSPGPGTRPGRCCSTTRRARLSS